MRWMVIYISVFCITLTDTLQLNLGDCPLYFDEPCRGDLVQFSLTVTTPSGKYVHILNPFKLDMPTGLNFTTQTKIVVHGYGGLSVDFASRNVTEAYQLAGFNVIEVNWSPLALTPCYITSFINTWHVGQCIAILAVSLSTFGITPQKVHVIGFSLGAHIASFASNNLQNVLGQQFARITGLDPALPFFATVNNNGKLDASDANFVDIIHTSSGTFGKLEASGHVDFYVNGGFLQPTCFNSRYPPLCSHLTAGLYFAESILSTNFIGAECLNVLSYILGYCDRPLAKTAVMGEHCDTTTRGMYFINTDDKPPFALG